MIEQYLGTTIQIGRSRIMNKSDLVQAVVEKTGLTKKESASAVDAMFEGISDSLTKGDKVQLVGFGTFEVRSRQAREGRNPATGETMKIKASKAPAFKAGKALKEKVK
jgi:DNA-binding protein HU-beta